MSGHPKPVPVNPSRGEIWNVDFDPSVGAEQKKTRPAVVVSPNAIGKLPLRIVVPITSWDDAYERCVWLVRIPQILSRDTGLTKESAADAFQVKSVALERFRLQIGQLRPDRMLDITAAIAICIGFSPRSIRGGP